VKKNLIVLAAFFCMNFPTNAFLQIRKNQIQANIGSRKNISPSLIVPVILITAGTTIVLTNDKTQLDEQIREAIRGNGRLSVDDYLIYVPLVTDIGLSLGGVRSRHNITDKALIYVLATSINALLVYPAKYLIGRERPDKSNLVSFPSGHSSNAFVGATYFWNEYQDIHPVLAGTGFANALVTGLFRIYNDKHWASDVICGAGIGILSAHLADWLYPSLKKIVPKSDKIVLKPIASSNEFGIAIDF
jgi:membrane-associated phospholipid phosphatase